MGKVDALERHIRPIAQGQIWKRQKKRLPNNKL